MGKAVTGQVKYPCVFFFSLPPFLVDKKSHHSLPERGLDPKYLGECLLHCSSQLALVVRPSGYRWTGIDRWLIFSLGCWLVACGSHSSPRLTKNSNKRLCRFTSWRVPCAPSPFHHFLDSDLDCQ